MSYEPGGSQKTESKSDVQKAWREIIEKVGSTPSFVFSITGDSDSFVPRPWAKSVFQTALIEAAKSAGDTWILYRGYNYGLSAIVRKAYQKYGDMEFRAYNRDVPIKDQERHVKLISIAGNSPKVRQSENKIKESENLQIEDLDERNTNRKRKHSKNKIVEEPAVVECYIETSSETSFLLDFEGYVSKQEAPFLSEDIGLKLPIPIVLLACEGDIHTIKHIVGALDRKIPVIIIKGSGKAADLIADYMKNHDDLKRKASILFGIRFDEKTFDELEENLKAISKASDLVTVFDLTCEDPLMLSKLIGEAVVSCWAIEKILRSKNQDVKTKSRLEMHKERSLFIPQSNGSVHIATTVSVGQLWKRNVVRPEDEDIKQEYLQSKETNAYVLNTKFSSPTSLPLSFYFEYQFLQELDMLEDNGHRLLFEALVANRCDYVRVLLDQGIQFRLSNLSDLYDQTVSCKDCHFEEDDCLHIQWLLKQIAEDKAKELCFTHRQIEKKINKRKRKETLEKALKEKEKRQKEVADSAKGLCRRILGYKDYDKDDDKDDKDEEENDEKIVKVSDILLWAIFANRMEISEICWLRTTDHLLTGLVCTSVLHKLSKKANNVKEQNLSIEFANHAKMFEERCLKLMDGMFEEDYKNAINVMDDEAVVWGIKSCPLTFAHENFMYDIVAHTCSQKNMNKRWYNNLAPDFKPFVKSGLRKPKEFIGAPITKYMFNYVMFFVMLVFYSAFVLTGVGDEYYSLDISKIFEYYVYLWGAGDLIEELISFLGCLESEGRSHRGLYSRLKRHLYDFWNMVDLVSYVLLIIALFVRHFHPSTNYTVARRMLSLSLLVMYLRFLEVFLVHRKMGPTLIMIKEMLKDLLYFLGLAVFVVLGVGMYYHANLWPDHPTIWKGNWVNWRIWTIIYYPYWQLYGEINNEVLEGEELSGCTNDTNIWKTDTSIDRCPEEDWTVIAVAGFYMLFSNLLLVNLVIAMFSYTFERVQQNSEKLWRFHRCTVINDYEQRIPSPINLLTLPYRLCCCPRRKGGIMNKCR
ncbi:transient receptor potential cation channel subfamily M member 2-like, partial [Saccostrea cucullata]|uniref:transient receptor potential cation channel subfamily M member 2-like n=1 Tax=Saccostrea cuccullata TaxID=36930 RepID=UPI002ED0F1D3